MMSDDSVHCHAIATD